MLVVALGVSATALAVASPARADMVLSEVIVNLPVGEVRKEIIVSNTGQDVLFITATLSEVVDPGLPTERRIEHDDPEAAGLIVTPNRVIVQPGQRKTLRIANIGDTPVRDRVYRLLVNPSVGDVGADATMLRVLVAYDVLVVVEPAEPAFELDWTRDGTSLVLTNRGNSNVLLQNGALCPSGGGECIEVPGRRVYPGATVTIELPAAEGAVNFLASGAGQHVQATF